MPQFRPFEILRTLAGHDVAYVLIGGLAATFHGAPVRTGDADICPDPAPENLRRLADALMAMDAGLRVDAEREPIPFTWDAHVLRRMRVVNLRTRFGALDITGAPAGFRGYDDLLSQAEPMEIEGVRVMVASLADVIRSKEVADRPKDHATLPVLYALQEEIAKREERS